MNTKYQFIRVNHLKNTKITNEDKKLRNKIKIKLVNRKATLVENDIRTVIFINLGYFCSTLIIFTYTKVILILMIFKVIFFHSSFFHLLK